MATGNIEELSVGFTGDLTGLRGALSSAAGLVSQGSGQMAGALGSVLSAGGLVTKMFAGMATALGSGALFKTAIAEAVSLGTEVGNLSRRFNIGAGDASTLATAIDDAFLSTQDFTNAGNALTRQLRTNEQSLNAMGLATRNADGSLRNQKELMFDALRTLREYKQGTDQMAAANVIFGRGMTEEVLNKLFDVQDNLDGAEESARKYGLMMGVTQVQAARDFRIAQDNVGDSLKGTAVTIGNALLPTIASLMNIMSEGGASTLPLFRGAAQLLSSSLAGLTTIVYDLWQVFKGLFFTISTGVLGLDRVLSSLVSGDFKGAATAWRETTGAIGEIWDETATNIANRTKQLADDMEKIWSDPEESANKVFKQGEGREGKKSFIDPKQQDAAAKELLAQFKAELELLKAVQGDYYELAKEDEVQFWQEKLGIFAKGTDQEREVYITYLRARRALAQENLAREREEIDAKLGDSRVEFSEKIRLATEWANQMKLLYGADSKEHREALRRKNELEREAAEQAKVIMRIRRDALMQGQLDEITLTREMLDFQVEIGALSIQERLRLEEELIRQRNELQRQELLRRREEAQGDVVEQARINAELLRLEQQLGLELGRLRIEQQRTVLGSWQQMFDGLFTTMEGVLQGLLTRTMTWRQAMQSIVGSLLQSFIKLGVEKVKTWIMTEVLMTNASKAGNLARNALAATGSATVMAAKATEATAVVGANATEAASGAAASQASIPVVGPALAMAAAAAMLAFVLGIGGGGSSSKPSVPSAAGGWWDIPRDTLAMVHKREMIMPGPLAEGVRDMVEGGGARGGDIFQIQATDAPSFVRLLETQGDAMFKILKDRIQKAPRSRT